MGYDSKLFVQEPSYDLICGICLDVFENCYITKCQHRYCLYCLQLILTTNEQECSYDRIKIIKEDCRVDKEVNEIVENLPINCQTCNKEISIKTLKTHDCGKQKEGMVIKGNNDIYTENSFKNWYKDILIVDKEICLRIFSFLNAKQICKISLVCKRWLKLCNYDKLWRFLYVNKFGKNQGETRDWKSLYMQKTLYMDEEQIVEHETFQFMRNLFDEKDFVLKSNNNRLPRYYTQSLKEQEEIQVQLALELSRKEILQKEMEDNLLKEEIQYEIQYEEDPDNENQSQVEEENVSESCNSTEVTPVEPKILQFATNKNMYQ